MSVGARNPPASLPEGFQIALDEAKAAGERGEVPIGAALVDPAGRIIARAGNRVEEASDPAAHAEMLVIRDAAARTGRPRLPDLTLYVTLEPCTMCAAAISFARLAAVVFAAEDPKGGGVVHGPRFFEQAVCHHRPRVERVDDGGLSRTLLKEFFRARRKGGALAGADWRHRIRTR